MNITVDKLTNKNLLVQPIHTAVRGRARYKVKGLHREEALKKYLECRLSERAGIAQVRANQLTGNVLVIFDPDISTNAIALLVKSIILDYRKEVGKLPITTVERTGQQVLISGVVGTLVLGTFLLHKYGLDTTILLAIQKLHSPIGDRLMLGITYLGEPITLLSICLGLGIGPLFYKRLPQATTLGMAALSAISLNYWLKMLFGRARPELWNRLIDVGLHSFPSGHAMMSMVVYGFLGYMLAKQFPQWRGRIFTSTAVLIAAIGLSRLYLGVHWPTDVVAGYAVGLMWLIVCILIWELQQQSRSLPETIS